MVAESSVKKGRLGERMSKGAAIGKAPIYSRTRPFVSGANQITTMPTK